MRGARILVLDDGEADARLAAALLEAAGFTSVHCESDSGRALRRHLEDPFDLIVVDLLMPGMDGLEFLRQARGDSPWPVPAIVITSAHDQMKRALDGGARDFIAKPLSAVELIPRVRNALQLEFLLRGTRSELVEAEDRYRALVEQSIAGIYIVDDDRFAYANPRMCELLGYGPGELAGKPTLDVVAEEDRPRMLANRARRDLDRSALVASYRMLRADGHVVHLSFDARLMDLKGRRVVFGVALDVTEREHGRELLRQAESHYRALVEQSIVGIYLAQDSKVIYANQRLCEMLGVQLADLCGLSLLDRVIERDAATVDAIRRRRAAGERGAIAFEVAMRHRDGSLVHLAIEAKVIQLGGNDAIIGLAQDVSSRRRASEALVAANQRLRTLSERVLSIQEEERRRISRELHDDLGQSLVALDMGLNRLMAHTPHAARALLDECIHVAAGVREKLREISVELHPPHLDQLGLGDALHWLVNRHAEMTGMEIACRVRGAQAAHLPAPVAAACYRICQEALSNATRHASANKVSVELDLRDQEAVVCVRDDGVGFDQAEQGEALFKSGRMGLISMEERARLAGGRLELRSTPGGGTDVTAFFPAGARMNESGLSKEPV